MALQALQVLVVALLVSLYSSSPGTDTADTETLTDTMVSLDI